MLMQNGPQNTFFPAEKRRRFALERWDEALECWEKKKLYILSLDNSILTTATVWINIAPFLVYYPFVFN